MGSLTDLTAGLTSSQVIDGVKNSSQENFFMYAFICFALIMIVGIVSIVSIFIRKDIKKDIRNTEQYKNMLDGYSKMIDQTAQANKEFRKTIDSIGEVLRQLTHTIAKSEAKNESENEKFELLFMRLDSLKDDNLKSNESLGHLFRDYDKAWQDKLSNVSTVIEKNTMEVTSLKEWCQCVNMNKIPKIK